MPIDRVDPQAPNVQTLRFAGKMSLWKVLRGELNAAEVAPTSANQCIHPTTFERTKFAVIVPAAVTAYTAHIGRWIRVKLKAATYIDRWVEEYHVSPTTSAIFEIENCRDGVGIYVDNVVGAMGSAVHILYQPTGRKAD